MAQDIIIADTIKKSFQIGADVSVEVLKGISLNIGEGEFVIIFGPSGCGKSTMLHTLLGLERPTSGKIIIDGKDFYAMSDDERAIFRRHNIGMIYQQPLWIGSLNVISNIMFPLHLLGIRQEEIEKKALETLMYVGLDKWAHYRPTELSSGQQQKVSLSRALMTNPRIIVADEPTGNLDTVSGQELIETFIKLVSEGRTIIMVTHDLEYLKYGTKIFHMVDGMVVEQYTSTDKIKKLKIEGKKAVNNEDIEEANVRDPEFLKKLHLD